MVVRSLWGGDVATSLKVMTQGFSWPPLLTPEVQDAICRPLELGVPAKYAARSQGIAESTFHEWMKKGAAGIEPYAAFHESVERSRARAVGNFHARALAGGPGASQATWFLERLFRKEYGLQVSVGGVGDGAPIAISPEHEVADAILDDPEALKKLHEVIATAIDARSKRNGRSTGKP
jgi:hypothetical protein